MDWQQTFFVANEKLYPVYLNKTEASTQGSANTTIKQEERFLIVTAESQKVLEMPAVMKWNATWQLNGVNGAVKTNNGIGLAVRQLRKCVLMLYLSYTEIGLLIKQIKSVKF